MAVYDGPSFIFYLSVIFIFIQIFYFSLYPSLFLSIRLPFSLSHLIVLSLLSAFLSVYLPLFLSICLSFCSFDFQYTLSTCLSLCLSVFLSVQLPFFLPIFFSLCPICVFISLSIFSKEFKCVYLSEVKTLFISDKMELIFLFLFLGFLPSIYPTENTVQTLQQEPTVFYS